MKKRKKPGYIKTPWGGICAPIKGGPPRLGTVKNAVEQTVLIGDRLNCKKRPLPP